MNNHRHEADELSAFVGARQTGGAPEPSSPEADMALDLLAVASAIRPSPALLARLSADLYENARHPSSAPLAPFGTDDALITENETMLSTTINNHQQRMLSQRDLRLTLVAVLAILCFASVLLLLTGRPSEERIMPAAQVNATPQPMLQGGSPFFILVGGSVTDLSDETLDRMWESGLRWVKTHVNYQAEFPQDGLNIAAEQIAAAHERGFGILIQILGTPDEVLIAKAGDYRLFGEFVGDLAALGPDGIQVWSEPNLDRSWPNGQIDPAEYTRMLAAAYTAAKAANENVWIISAAPAPTMAEADFPGAVMNDDRFYQGMADAGAADYADCIGLNYVEGILPPTEGSGDPRDEIATRYFVPMLQRAAGPFRGEVIPVCVTEMGYASFEGIEGEIPMYFGWAADTTTAEQAEWIAEAIYTAARLSSIHIAFINIWRFDTVPDDSTQAAYAIVRPDGSCPTCDVLIELQQQP